MTMMKKLTVEKNDPRLCIAGTEHLWSVCLKTRDKLGASTEVLAENVVHEYAVLFAAAPELLDALKTLIEGIEHLDIHGADYARQIVAKAEGRDI